MKYKDGDRVIGEGEIYGTQYPDGSYRVNFPFRSNVICKESELLPAPPFAVGAEVEVSDDVEFSNVESARYVAYDPKSKWPHVVRAHGCLGVSSRMHCRKPQRADTKDKLLEEAMGILKEVETLPMKVAEKIRPLLERHEKLKCATAESKSQG